MSLIQRKHPRFVIYKDYRRKREPNPLLQRRVKRVDDDDGERLGGDQSSRGDADLISEDFPPAREINVDMEQMYAVEFVSTTNSIAIACVEQLVNNIRAGGLTVTLDLMGAKVKLNELHQVRIGFTFLVLKYEQKLFDCEWNGMFLKDLVWHLLMFGFAVVTLVESNLKEGEMVPKVENISNYLISFTEAFGKRREYRVYPVDSGSAYRMFMKDQGESSKRGKSPYPHASVYALFAPHSSGKLSSPLASVFHDLITGSFMKENMQVADYDMSHPPRVSRPCRRRRNPMCSTTTDLGDNLVGVYHEEMKKKIERTDRNDVQASIRAAYDHQMSSVGMPGAGGYAGQYGANPAMFAPPYTRVFMPGVNHQIAELPRAAHNPLYVDIMQTIAQSVSGVLGIPPQFTGSKFVQHAANAELEMRMFDKTIGFLMRLFEPIFQDLYDACYRMSHANFRNQIYREIVQSKRDEERRAQTSSQFGNYIRSTGEPSQSTLPPPKERGKGDEIRLSKILGRNVTSDQPKRKFGFSPPTKELSDEQVKQMVANDVRFVISFGRTPLTDTATIHDAYDVANIIAYDSFSRFLAQIGGIPQNRVLTEEEHYAQIEKKAKIEADLMDKYTPKSEPVPAAPGGGGASKPAAKMSPPGTPPASIGMAFGGGAKPAAAKGGARGSGQLNKPGRK